MINLIRNELYKIFHKKGIYIVLIITVLFSILTNYLYSTDLINYNYVDDDYEMELYYLEMLEEEKNTNIEEYLYSKSYIKSYEYAKSFGEESWQRVVLTNDLEYNSRIMDIYYRIVSYEEKETNNLEDYLNAKNELEALKNELNSITEEEFINNKLLDVEKKLLDAIQNDDKELVATYEAEISSLMLRLKYKISYAFDDKNDNLDTYQYNLQTKLLYEEEDVLKEEEKEMYDLAKEEVAIAYATIENSIYESEISTNYGILVNFYNEYFIMILVIIVLISGSIVSEEFSKGTIKLLLVKPYTRVKIIMSKYLTTILMVLFAIVAPLLIQTLIGGIFFGYDGLSTPIAVYNNTTETVELLHILKYFGLTTIAILPQLILTATIAFTLSTIFTSTSLANTLTIIGVFGSDIINVIAQTFEIEILKFFVTLNWDFTPFLFGGSSPYKGITLPFSIAICIIYLLVMLLVTILVFKKRNIKNI